VQSLGEEERRPTCSNYAGANDCDTIYGLECGHRGVSLQRHAGAIRGKNMPIPLSGLDQAARDWAISLIELSNGRFMLFDACSSASSGRDRGTHAITRKRCLTCRFLHWSMVLLLSSFLATGNVLIA
jgi:hypothetical protein